MKKTTLSIAISLIVMMLISCSTGVTPVEKNKLSHASVSSLLDIDIRALVAKAEVAKATGDYEVALRYYLQVWERRGDNVQALYEIASLYAILGEAELSGRFLYEVSRFHLDHFSVDNVNTFDGVRENEAFVRYTDRIKEHYEKQARINGTSSFIEVTTMLRYNTILPDDFDPQKAYRVLISLHGYGGSAGHNHTRLSEHIQDSDIIFIAPNAPFPLEVSRNQFTSYSWSIWGENNSLSLATEYIVQLVDEIKNTYNVSEIFLSGFSQGGMMTLYIGVHHHELFAGLICFGGALFDFIPHDVLVMANSVPVLIVHGEADMVVRYEAATSAYQSLQSAGFDVTLQPFDGVHNIPKDVFLQAIQWMDDL
jgi:phospholipase/carboxylesterase